MNVTAPSYSIGDGSGRLCKLFLVPPYSDLPGLRCQVSPKTAICALRDPASANVYARLVVHNWHPKSLGFAGGVSDLYYALFHIFRHALRSPGDIFCSTVTNPRNIRKTRKSYRLRPGRSLGEAQDVLSIFPRNEVRGALLRQPVQPSNNPSLGIDAGVDPTPHLAVRSPASNDKVKSQMIEGNLRNTRQTALGSSESHLSLVR